MLLKCLQTLLVLLVVLGAGAPAVTAGNPYADLLRKNGIEPTGQGVLTYLDRIRPTPAARQKIGALVVQLNAFLHADRHRAENRLFELGLLARPQIEKAAESDVAETAFRARRLLRKLERTNQELVLRAALETVRIEKPKGTARRVLAVAPLCSARYLRRAAQRALKAAATPGDVGRLRRALAHENIDVRVVALPALAGLLGREGADELAPLLEADEPDVRLAAARALADLGVRKTLGAFLALMSSEDVRIRSRAHACLRELTRRRFGYVAYADEKERAKATAEWREWIEKHAAKAKLHVPLKGLYRSSHLHGRTLLAYGYRHKVEELTPAGKVAWTHRVPGAWSAEKMANGNILVASYSQRKVLEITPKKKIAWQYSVRARNAEPLPNGNVLIADYQGKRVMEVAKQGKKIVWQQKVGNYCYDAQRLPNGNTLVSTRQSVREITPGGKTAWEWKGGSNIMSAQRLPNGNTLLADYSHKRVIELSPAKKIVWEFKENQPSDAFRLPNGNTLITGTRFIEVTPGKKIVWTRTGCRYGTARK